ncbi:AP-3 complex subunit beta-2 [Hyalella azteca]|uniref:AP-3 complex subunit beta n=1 Tax=Hyalella azteca TaxID=294128 RepID=A0A8B7NUX7_HYAAZ|nr:AP-3 complex subunit beta-2 [Hyalella azteca]
MTTTSMDMTGYGGSERSSGVGDTDYAGDVASGGIFTSDYKKYDDLKQMLDSNKDNLKLEAMKRIIGMVAKGRDASELFAAVVKNVVSSNLEVKKLVYVYLVRYAEEQQDLALLSISTFQRALKDPNQLIRACALRVLSSIRVSVIVPIMMLAIKESVMDMSPYVRKTAAHAIPKLYSLDPEQKEELMQVLERLLNDNTTLVMGSAVMAFEEVCPERIDLIHCHYRKLCVLLVEVEEWGQVVIINMLTRYARTQFRDPNRGDNKSTARGDTSTNFYGEENDDEDTENPSPPPLDPDHRLLLRNTKPLLQSRNAAVVLAVSQLYQHIAPSSEASEVVRAMVRLMRSHRETQAIVLSNIASITTQRKGLFEPHLKSFFVRSSDPTHIKVLKLEVLTNLATESNISGILRELQTYLGSSDKQFVAATIQAIGRCASSISSVTDSCLSGLVTLLSHRDECVVGESVVVVRKLLQTEAVPHKDIIKHMARLLPSIRIATARASILWLLGEHCEKVPNIAPDVLRICAKSFCSEEDSVKLQILTLATKLQLSNPQQTVLLCQYVYNLAKYDANYDIRDRARLLRAVVLPSTGDAPSIFTANAKGLFMAYKPPPQHQSTFKDREQFQLGTLSHFINARASGYKDLPDFPEEAPDPTVRSVPEFADSVSPKHKTVKKTSKTAKKFYSSGSGESEDESDESSDEESESSKNDDGSKKESDCSSTSSSQEEDSGSSSDEEESSSSSSSSDSDEESSSSEEDSSGNAKQEQQFESSAKKPVSGKPTKSVESKTKSNLDMLLSLDEVPPSIDTPMLTPSMGGFLPVGAEPSTTTPGVSGPVAAAVAPGYTYELLNRVASGGLAIKATFTRSPHLYCPKMATVQLSFTNYSDEIIHSISMETSDSKLFHPFPSLSNLAVGNTAHATLGVDFCDSSQSASLGILADGRRHGVAIAPRVGELVAPTRMDEATFTQHQGSLRGMHEQTKSGLKLSKEAELQDLVAPLLTAANLWLLQHPQSIRLCGKTLSGGSVVLVVVTVADGEARLTVHCEKLTVASMLLKELAHVIDSL